ncbi:hypothetical protein RND81_01G017600 [Saponaria officinalis]|uniref:Lipid droplet-associated hydrolase n=3 Tax=Saponaria officinalis TaxID=3572 RepID=A0AAW1NBY9_SAPOF
MFRHLLCTQTHTCTAIFRPVPLYSTTFRLKLNRHYNCGQMSSSNLISDYVRKASTRLCNVSGHMTELLEIISPNPTLHVLFIPGNPGIVNFYTDFLESLYEQLDATASITAIGHISQTAKDWERGRLFSLEEQINHKIDFIAHELQSSHIPVILVGHSVGSYISIEIFKRASPKVNYFVGLYPFLTLNAKSYKQTAIKKLTESRLLCFIFSLFVTMMGLIPSCSRYIVKKTIGSTWSDTAVDAGCSHLLKYHTIRNVLFMAKTEFQKFSGAPDWKFLGAKQDQIAFLFGIDDHWGPLSLFEEISKQTPEMSLSIEKEGHDHAFSCTVAGSRWVAQHVSALIQKRSSTL